MTLSVQRPIFSVVIPVYNVSRYICECIDSVLQQTFASFEIICVDDESPDNSVALIREYDDPRIRIVSQSNRGLAGARNTGINASRGVFVALLDADDSWHPEKLAKHFEHLQLNPNVGVSFSASLFIDQNSNQLGIGQFPQLKGISPEIVFCRNPIGNGSAAVLKKSLLHEVGKPEQTSQGVRMVYFDENLRQSEDIDFWVRVALTSRYDIEGIGEALTFYRVNASGLSANLEKQYIAWMTSVSNNRHLNPKFFDLWFPLASAYQKRYLARRAIQNGSPRLALSLMHSAICEDRRILKYEFLRTSVTYVCAWLAFLPQPIFSTLMTFGMSSNYLRAKA